MVLAWLLTLPAAGVLGAAAGSIADHGTGGEIIVLVLGIAIAAGIFRASRRAPVTADNVNVEDTIVPPALPDAPVGVAETSRES
jgi:PiT family inorganic phosphate transporter